MMKRREWIVAGLVLLLFWAVAGLMLAPRLERRLNEAAAVLVSRLDAEAGGARFDRVQVRFDGQRARVSGAVRYEADARRLLSALREEVRTPGNRWNPLRTVEAGAELEVRPLESGWLVVAMRGTAAEVVGVCATSAEREALEAGLRGRWPVWRGEMVLGLTLDQRRFDEAGKWAKTVAGLPAPVARGKGSARLLVARIGEAWQDLPLEESESAPAGLLAAGATLSEWRERVRPLVAEVAQHAEREAAWEREQERLSRLPPPHVFLARRGEQVLLRGEVYDVEAKRAVLSSVMAAMPGKRILDDLRAAGARRPGGGLGGLDEVVSEEGEKTFALGVPERDWVVLDWQVAREALPWEAALPEGLTVEAVREDSAVLIDWLQGSNAGIPLLPAPPQPAFLTLAVFAGRVVIGGQMAEEALRAQVVEAVKRAYPAGWVLRDEMAVSGRCVASESVQHTVQSVPVKKAQEPMLLAVALPGESWRLLPQAVLADRAVLETEGLLPKALQAATVAASLGEVLEEMEAQGIRFPHIEIREVKRNPSKP
jgi:hypothetical protein